MTTSLQQFLLNGGTVQQIIDKGGIVKDYGHKLFFTYNGFNVDWSFEPLRMCRGTILEKHTLALMSFPFRKFFNHGEKWQDTVDFSTGNALIKEDGTFIHLYYDYVVKKWFAGTTGMAEAEGNVGDEKFSFSDLFWRTVHQVTGDSNKFVQSLQHNNVYMFELCTPYNQVVTRHPVSKVILLGARNLTTFQEYDYNSLISISRSIDVPLVKSVGMRDIPELIHELSTLSKEDEGFVVVDKNFNRVKIKNPQYVLAHHVKNSTSVANLMEMILKGESEEFITYVPERAEEIRSVETKLNSLCDNAQKILNDLINSQEFKEYKKTLTNRAILAQKVKELSKTNVTRIQSFLFSYIDGKATNYRYFLIEKHTAYRELYDYLLTYK